MAEHLVGMLLGTEEDWPSAFEALFRRLNPRIAYNGEEHNFRTDRITIEPFDLRAEPRYRVVIDRLAYWYYVPREWLKKVAILDDVYLLNNPYTFQSMEKHAAYCAMIRLGLKVPNTWLIPHKQPPENPRFPYTAARYNEPFDLEAVAERVGYPLYMKPYDGGAWVGVSRIENAEDLRRRYDESGQRLMHLQAAVEGFDVFARSLSIGAETMVMRYDPSQPLHGRYSVAHGFLDAATGAEVVTIGRLVNAFFRWEFNSCETLVRAGEVYPIDYANACPDVSLTSLHYYFPWAMKTLVKWSVFCAATGRKMRVNLDVAPYFAVGDSERSYGEKLAEYARLSDEYFERESYHDFCAAHLSHVDEVTVEYIESAEFDRLLVDTVIATFPPHEHEHFVAHYRGLLAAWASDERAHAA
jgi:hypothetical protein